MSTFIISPLNSLTFKHLDGLLPNYNNTLDRYDKYQDSINVQKCQQFLTSETIVTQIRTDYDTIVATLYDSDNSPTVLTVTEVSTYTDYSFYEFSVTGLSAGEYRIIVNGTDASFDEVLFECEPFELVVGKLKKTGLTTVRVIEDFKRIKYYQEENSFYIDYSTGIEHFIWIPAISFKLQPTGEVDVYNNLDNNEKLEQTNYREFQLQTYQIQRHVAIKFAEASSMDFISINDIECVFKEVLEITYYNDSSLATIVTSMPERYSIGVNSDDQGYGVTEQVIGGGSMLLVGQDDLSAGTAQFSVQEGYAIRHIQWRLTAGTSATIDLGSTVGGEDITKNKTISTLNQWQSIDRSAIVDWDSLATVYLTKTGVGAVIDFWITTETFRTV